MPKLFDLAFFPAAKGADKFHLLRLDQLASLLNVNHKDSTFLDDRGEERPYQDLDKYIFYSYERISLKQPEKLNPSPNRKYLTFDPSFRVVNRPATPQILMLFEENRNPGRQPWVFQRWCVGLDHVILAKSRSHTATHTTMRLNGPEEPPPIFLRKEKEKTTVPVTIPASLHQEEVQRPTGHLDEAMADEAPLAFAAQPAEDAAANSKARSAGTRELTNMEDCIAHRAAAQPAAAATPVEFERAPAEPALPSKRHIAEKHLERHLSTKPMISERVEVLLKESIEKDQHQISVHSHFKEWLIKERLPDLHRELSHELEVGKDATAFFLEALVREAQKGTAWNNKEKLHAGDDGEKLARKQELLSRIVTYEQLCCVSDARLASGTSTFARALSKIAVEVNCTTTYLGQYLAGTQEFKAAVDRLVDRSRDLDASSSVERDSPEARIEARIADAAVSIAHKDWVSGYKAKSKGLSADPVGKGNMDRRGKEGEAGVEQLLQVQHGHPQFTPHRVPHSWFPCCRLCTGLWSPGGFGLHNGDGSCHFRVRGAP